MAVTTSKRCGEIDLFRFVFCVIIMLRHGDGLYGESLVFPGGAFGVEFFFLVSGFLMMASIERKKLQPIISLGDETLVFIKGKLCTLYPEVFISLFIAFVVQCIAKQYTITQIIKLACDSLFEVMLLSHSGIGGARLYGPIWYLSTMILAMMFLYPLIRKYQDTMVKIVLPLLAFFILGFLVKNYNHFRTPSKWLFVAYKGFLRGVAELCLGALLYWATRYLRNMNFTTMGKTLLTAIKWFCWLSVIAYTVKTIIKYDPFFVVVLSVAIVIAFSQQGLDVGIYENRVIYFLGKYSLPLYLNHRYFSLYLGDLLKQSIDKASLIMLYIVASAITAGIVMVVSNMIRRSKSILCNCMTKLFIK